MSAPPAERCRQRGVRGQPARSPSSMTNETLQVVR
jgi:hypothetical protein